MQPSRPDLRRLPGILADLAPNSADSAAFLPEGLASNASGNPHAATGNAMSPTDPPFAPAEYAARLVKVRAALARAVIDTLEAGDPSNIGWLTGYDAGRSTCRRQ
jgi:hypothetical protein